MIRALYHRLCQLLHALFGWGGSDNDNQTNQETDRDAESWADAEHGDDPDRVRGDTQSDDGTDGDDNQDGNGGDGGGGADPVDADADADADADVEAAADNGEDGLPNHSSDEGFSMTWPPTDPVPWSDRPVQPENTIEIRLYHADAELGLQACRQTAPHLEWALLDAWANRFDLDVNVTVRAKPVPEKAADPETFDNWIWEDGVSMAKDANILVVDSGAGAAGGYSGHVNGPEYFDGWEFDPSVTYDEGQPQVVPYGDSEARVGLNRVIHETLHCLGLSHNGRFDEFELVDWYGQSYLPPLWTSYRDHNRHTIRLCAANQRVRPSVQ
jgi:hypothetical protein